MYLSETVDLLAAAQTAPRRRSRQAPDSFIPTLSWTAGERTSAWDRLWAMLLNSDSVVAACGSEGGVE